MLQSELYCGLPNEIWNNLVCETEDILREEEIGNHIVGIYPSGSRIFGIEADPPELLCLYIDSPENIIDPSVSYDPDTMDGVHTVTTDIDCRKITYIDLYAWAKWLLNRESCSEHYKLIQMHDIIPCHQDIAYQDPVVDDLLLLAKKYISKTINVARFPSDGGKNLMLKHSLYVRTLYLLEKEGRFCPNTNEDWGKVNSLLFEVLPEGTEEIDRQIIDLAVNNRSLKNIKKSIFHSYSTELMYEMGCFNGRYKDQHPKVEELRKEIGKEVAKIYKFLL